MNQLNLVSLIFTYFSREISARICHNGETYYKNENFFIQSADERESYKNQFIGKIIQLKTKSSNQFTAFCAEVPQFEHYF